VIQWPCAVHRTTEKTRARAAGGRAARRPGGARPLAKGGYASASVAAVARRAGSHQVLYRHFPSGADLFAEVFRVASQREVDV
jgi:AcrR family transcriptional regulator